MSLNALNEYYADESRSYAIGFANWITDNCIKVQKIWFLKKGTEVIQKSLEELYNIYVKQLEQQWQTKQVTD